MTSDQTKNKAARILYELERRGLVKVQGKTLAEIDTNVKQAETLVYNLLVTP